MSTKRVLHFLNQFFAGAGGEELADADPAVLPGPVGPGRLLQKVMGDDAEVVATLYCGDNFANEHPEKLAQALLDCVREYRADLVVSGPAFNAGRYGLACGRVCTLAAEEAGLPAVTSMFPDNPGVEMYRQQVYILPAGANAGEMPEAMKSLGAFALKLAGGDPIGSSATEGYLPRGLRYTETSDRPAGARAVDMLLKKLTGEEFRTEWPVPLYDRVPPAPALQDLAEATLAIVTSGGVVPRGNRDRLESARATNWFKYSIAGAGTLEPDQWISVHGGFDTTVANEDPNRIVPLDVLREMEDSGVFRRLVDDMYVTMGNQAGLENAHRFGREIARELIDAEVDGVVFVAT